MPPESRTTSSNRTSPLCAASTTAEYGVAVVLGRDPSGRLESDDAGGHVQDIVRAEPRHHFHSRRLPESVADQDLAFPSGSRHGSSNSDDVAVALMAEQATGRPHESLLRDLVYRPPGLRETSLPRGHRLALPVPARLRHGPGRAAGGRQRGDRRVWRLGLGRHRLHTGRPLHLHRRPRRALAADRGRLPC
nr:beta-lactamase family protein [Streptomyces sp. NRRL B-24572]